MPPVLRVLLGLLALLSVAFCLRPALPLADQTPSLDRAFEPPAPQTASWLLARARAQMSGETAATGPEAAPPEATQPRPTVLLLTAFTSGREQPEGTVVGRGESPLAALDNALAGAGGSGPPDRLQLDLLTGPPQPLEKPLDSAGRPTERRALELLHPGRDGLAVTQAGATRFLTSGRLVYRELFSGGDDQQAHELLDRAVALLGLPDQAWRSSDLALARFSTVAFVESADLGRALPLVGAAVPNERLELDRLLAAARAGGDFLVRLQRPNGAFQYSYDPLRDNGPGSAYNFVRHAGVAFSLFELYSATGDRRYLETANRAVSFLKTRFRPVEGRAAEAAYVLDNDGKAKLGANGLALVALSRQARLDPASADLQSARLLAGQILALQNSDGSFESYHRIRGDEPSGSVSLYYPGEALLGLVGLYELTGEASLLEAAQRGAAALIRSQRARKSLLPDAWLMQALEALHRQAPQPDYAAHALAIAESMLASQQGSDARPGFAGGFGSDLPSSTSASARSEGIVAAYRLARDQNDPRAATILAGLRAAVRFHLNHQLDADNSFYLPNPARAQGAVRESPASLRVRMDYVQHHLASLLGLAALER